MEVQENKVKVTVTPVRSMNDMLSEVRFACSVTSSKYSKISLDRILKMGHSPMRLIEFKVYIEGIPYCNAMHFRTHSAAGQKMFTSSSRGKRDAGEKLYQDAPVNMVMYLNAEHLIQMGHARLCLHSDKLTTNIMRDVQKKVAEYTPTLAQLMKPLCKSCRYPTPRCIELRKECN